MSYRDYCQTHSKQNATGRTSAKISIPLTTLHLVDLDLIFGTLMTNIIKQGTNFLQYIIL